tara:strand:- start:108 stop:284 length:177 start_codon:yes stop_codon:yes gene_type:complete
MKHLWLILFVIIGCTSPEPILPQIDNIEYLSYKKPDKKKGWGIMLLIFFIAVKSHIQK